jgi:hypothetical protein
MTRLVSISCAVAISLATVAVVATVSHKHAPLDVAAALVLAIAAPLGVRRAASRTGPAWFAGAAPLAYALLPVLGALYALAGYRHTFVHDALPELVGLQRPLALALGTAVVVLLGLLPARALAVAGAVAVVVALFVWGTSGVGDVRNGLHETGWSPTLAGWIVVAGLLGLALSRSWLALGAGGWIVAVLLRAADGGYGHHGEFWRALSPAAPEIGLLVTALALLIPRLRRARRLTALSEGG